MWKKKPQQKTQKSSAKLKIGEQEIPVHIYLERRNNARVSIGKTGLNIRLPDLLPRHEQAKQVERFYEWALQKYAEKPHLLQRQIAAKQYKDGHTFLLQARHYTLHITDSDKATGSARLVDDDIYLRIPVEWNDTERNKKIPQLASRVLAKRYYKPMYDRLHQLNDAYFKKTINEFRLKYVSSVWGSCSRKGNINISTRLLFATPDVIDYVLIHELAHLVHADHSPAFWAQVARVMPNYKQQEQWLKKHGHKCDI